MLQISLQMERMSGKLEEQTHKFEIYALETERLRNIAEKNARSISVTTESNWVAHLRENHKLVGAVGTPFDELMLRKWDGWFEASSDIALQFPILGLGENPREGNGTQFFVTEMLQKICETFTSNKKGIKNLSFHAQMKRNEGYTVASQLKQVYNIPDPIAFKHCSFKTRKPDIVCYAGDTRGSLSITIIGDVKGRSGDGNFPDAEIGHLLDFVRVLLTDIQPFRSEMMSFLTDGYRFQFFYARRENVDTFKYFESAVYIGAIGWQV